MCMGIPPYEGTQQNSRLSQVTVSFPDEVIGRTMALESTQLLTEMSIRNLPGGKGRQPKRKADNLTTICEPPLLTT
jgi:hypothetical protein